MTNYYVINFAMHQPKSADSSSKKRRCYILVLVHLLQVLLIAVGVIPNNYGVYDFASFSEASAAEGLPGIFTTKLFTDLGFILNHEKSVLEPKQVITFLEKATKLVTNATTVLSKQSPSVREVTELVGLMVSSFPGVMHGPLFYRQLELDKVMRARKGDFNALKTLSETSKSELQW